MQSLRIFLVALVVAHHAGQPYGPTGGEWPVSDPANSDLLLPFFAINAAFFMGFFFLISGYFIEGSYDRRGPRAFLMSRLLRLGVPLVVFVVFAFGAVDYASATTAHGFFGYLWTDYLGPRMEFGPLWFIAHLLVYASLYLLWRLAVPVRKGRAVPNVPGHMMVALYALALTAVTLAVRQVWPQDVWVRLFWLVPAEPMHLPQYSSLFVIGIIASRGNWFVRIPGSVGYVWFWLAIVLFLGVAAMSALGADAPGPWAAEDYWQLIDSVICIGMILGLLVFFRRNFDRTGPLARRVAGATYGIYLIHVFVVVGLQMALLGTELGALSKFALVAGAGFALSFVLIDILRRVPLVRRVI